MKYVFLTALCAIGTVFGGSSIRLVNDSAFTLEATIISAEGNVMASRTIAPQQFYQWTYSPPVRAGNFNPISPFTVVWRCTDNKEFGVSTYVGNAQWAQASTSNGPQYCTVKQHPSTQRDDSGQQSQPDPDSSYP